MTKIIPLPFGEESLGDTNAQVADAINSYNEEAKRNFETFKKAIASLPEKVQTVVLNETLLSEAPMLTFVNSGIKATISDARRILGIDFIGPEEVKHAFGKNAQLLAIETLPDTYELPFTIGTLERMHKIPEGCVLIYQSKNADGTGIDIATFAKLQKELQVKGEGKLLYRDQFKEDGTLNKSSWLADGRYHEHHLQQTITHGWRLVTKKILDGTINLTLIDKIALVCEKIETLYADTVLPQRFAHAITEFRTKEAQLRVIQPTPAFLTEISKISFWKDCMEKGIETLYRLVVYNQITGEKILVNMYTRNAVTEPVNGRIGYAGDGGDVGPRMGEYMAGGQWGPEGLLLSFHSE